MKSLQMLLRVVLALAILLQGSFGVGSAYAEARSGHHGHASPTAEGHPAKCPCCPKSSDVDCASFCALVALPAAISPVFPKIVAADAPVGGSARWIGAAVDRPLRPPIA